MVSLKPPNNPPAKGSGLAEEMRRVPFLPPCNIPPRQRGSDLHTAGDKVADLEAGCNVTPLNGLKIRQSNTVVRRCSGNQDPVLTVHATGGCSFP